METSTEEKPTKTKKVAPKRRHAGKLEVLWRERQERDLALCERKGGHSRGLRFDAEAGDFVVKWIEKFCKHHKGKEWAGKPLLLEQWQKDVIRQAFGWKRADGTRRFRTMYIEVARKNGKSEIAAALGLYLLVADGEDGAEVYSSATKKDQARIVWKTAKAMVNKSPALKTAVKVYQSSLVVEDKESSFQPLSSESNTLDGLNPHGNIVDELHAHKDRGVWDVLDSAMGAREQPMTVAITTAGTFNQESIGWEQHDYARKVLEGMFEDDAFYAFIACPDEGDDNFGEAAQQKANPNWGVSAKVDFLQKQAVKAQRTPGFFNEYVTKHLNLWAQQTKRWLPMDKWNGSDPAPAGDLRAAAILREKALERMKARAGLDLSSKLDLTAFVLEFQRENEVVELICRFWIPEAQVKLQADRGRRHYEVWAREGWLTVTAGDVIDYEFIRKEVNALCERHVVGEIAYDPWNALDLATRLSADGRTMVECHQGYKTLSEPSKDVEAKVVQGKVKHMNNPVLRWCASNVSVSTDPAGNIKPDKAKATDKIDGIVAWVMARSRGIVNKEENRSSLVLDQGGIVLG